MGLEAVAALALALASVAFVLYPIVRGQGAPLEDEEEGWEAEAQKRAALAAPRVAGHERAARKVDGADLPALRADGAAEAPGAIRAADAAGPVGEAPAGEHDEHDELEREVECYRRALRAGTVCGECRRANEPGSRYCAGCGAPLSAARCPACGHALAPSERACPVCGAGAT